MELDDEDIQTSNTISTMKTIAVINNNNSNNKTEFLQRKKGQARHCWVHPFIVYSIQRAKA